jgi:hypothetical protein
MVDLEKRVDTVIPVCSEAIDSHLSRLMDAFLFICKGTEGCRLTPWRLVNMYLQDDEWSQSIVTTTWLSTL